MSIHYLITTLLLITFTPYLLADEFLNPTQIKTLLEAEKTTGKYLSEKKTVYFCWSKPDHPKHVHGYQRFAESYASELNSIKNMEATAIEGYPTNEQWKVADLVIFNLTQSDLCAEQFRAMDMHLSAGGSVIIVHQALVQRKGYEEWAKRIGLAFSWAPPPARSKWGKGVLEISLNTEHEIFKGFPKTIQVEDELYWNLRAGKTDTLTVLGECNAPTVTKEQPSTVISDRTSRWPAFWVLEHPASEAGVPTGRVFSTVISRHDKVAFSSSFKVIMKRAIAWCMHEPTEVFFSSPAAQ